jgi:hypothetical protein
VDHDGDDLQLLLARPGGAPVLDRGLGTRDLLVTDPSGDHEPEHLWDESGEANDLPAQRWGVFAPEGPVGDRLLALVQPLIAHRRQQQGDHEVQIYRVPAKLGPLEALRWRKRNFEAGAGLRVDLPRYQLLLGDLDVMPLALQHAFACDGFPGRLAFASDDGYAAYVQKVLRWETCPEVQAAHGLLCGVRDGTPATAIGQRALLDPGIELLRDACSRGQLEVAGLDPLDLGDEPDPSILLRRAAATRAGVLFSVSHGEGAPREGWTSPVDMRARQGAMSFGRAGSLTAADLTGRPFMPGGVWCMLACYGAGTPDRSAYRHWLDSLSRAGRYFGRPEAVLTALPKDGAPPFIAALPQAALASDDGPLAFVGHVDLAWTYGFQELDDRPVTRPGRLMALMRALLRGDRAGVALREVARGVGMANVELTCLFDQDSEMTVETGPAEQARRAHLWMLRNDLAAYVLLGDPAARLPLAPREPAPVWPAQPAPMAVTTPQGTLRAQMTAREPEPPALDDPRLVRLESLILKYLAGEALDDLAADAGLPIDELRAAADAYRDAARLALGRHLAGR